MSDAPRTGDPIIGKVGVWVFPMFWFDALDEDRRGWKTWKNHNFIRVRPERWQPMPPP